MEYITEKPEVRAVERYVSVVGSVEAGREVNLAFKQSGTIEEIYVEEGQQVGSGTLLMELDLDIWELDVASKEAALRIEKANLEKLLSGLTEEQRKTLDTTLQNAQKALVATQETKVATEDSLEEQVVAAEKNVAQTLQVLQQRETVQNQANDADVARAQAALQGALDNFEDTLAAGREQISSGMQAVRQAETALSNAQKELAANIPIQDKNLQDAQENTFYDAVDYLTDVEDTLREINEIITVEEYNKDANEDYRHQLGARKLNSYNNTITQYNQLKNAVGKQEGLFQITAGVLAYDEIVSRMDTLRELLNKSYDTLTQTKTMLNNTITSIDLTTAELDAFKDAIDAQRATVTSSLSGLASLKQKVENLELQKTSANTTLDNAVASAEAALAKAENDLRLINVQAEAANAAARSNLDQAKEQLRSAEAAAGLRDVEVLQLEQAYEDALQALDTIRAQAEEQERALIQSVTDREAQVQSALQAKQENTAAPRKEDIEIQEARVEQATAALKLAQEQLEGAQITAPFDGVVASILPQLGEQVQAGSLQIRLINNDVDTLITNIAETEIADVAAKQKARFDFDAFTEEEVYEGTVSFVSPDKTDLDGVIYFETQVYFDRNQYSDRTVRPGYSATVEIITESIEALSVPNQTIREREDESTYVRVLVRGKEQERDVEVGLQGEEYTEILSGLVGDEDVILTARERE